MDTNAASHESGVVIGRSTSGILTRVRTVHQTAYQALDMYGKRAEHPVDQEALEDLRRVEAILNKYKRTTSGKLHSLEQPPRW